jgi:hypothetical protein
MNIEARKGTVRTVKIKLNTSSEYVRFEHALKEVLLWRQDQIEQSLRQADAGKPNTALGSKKGSTELDVGAVAGYR